MVKRNPDSPTARVPVCPSVVFFGTPDYVVPVLSALYKNYDIAAVITQPPKPVGRKQVLTPSPVALWAKKHKIQVITSLKSAALLCSSVANAQVGIVAAYGQFIPKEILKALPYGILNIHPSLLPKWRGAAPIEASIISQQGCGVTIIKIDEEMDHGPIVGQSIDYCLQSTDTETLLREKLFQEGAKLLVEVLPKYMEGKIRLREQEHEKANYTSRLTRQDGFIPPEYFATTLSASAQGYGETEQSDTFKGRWEIGFMQDVRKRKYVVSPTPEVVERFIRAMMPWPGAWTLLRQGYGGQAKRLKIFKAHLESGKLVPDLVQLEGKKPIFWKQFKEGYQGFRFTG